jgi:phosphate/sulfate permease
MSELEGLFNIWVFLAIAAGACVMILINIIEAYILKLKHRRKRNELTINSDIDLINLQGLRTRRGNYTSKNREDKNKNKNKNTNGSKSN